MATKRLPTTYKLEDVLQPYVDKTADYFRCPTKWIRVKRVHGGRCNNGYITIPLWVREYHKQYWIYYAVHEICHSICYYLFLIQGFHSKEFKLIEDQALALWNIEITRKKVYPKKLFYKGREIKNIK